MFNLDKILIIGLPWNYFMNSTGMYSLYKYNKCKKLREKHKSFYIFKPYFKLSKRQP